MTAQYETSKPVFVIGSPRSGTSILTWCLGHHPNLFPVPESNWMGTFAVQVGIACRIGGARGDYSILSAMEIPDDELFAAIGRGIHNLILHHRGDLEKRRERRIAQLKLEPSWLHAASMAAGPKRRWVDGTPEYSFHVWGLRKLFPSARFIHVVRDVQDVVRSMVNFHQATGIQLVASEEEAYQYWTRTVKACLMAERACGPKVVRRVRYADLTAEPESTVRSLLEFLDEPFTEKCLEPLANRINSSRVAPDSAVAQPAAHAATVSEATRLFTEINNVPQPTEPSAEAANSLEAAFWERVNYEANLDKAYEDARQEIAKLRKLTPSPIAASGNAHHTSDPAAAPL